MARKRSGIVHKTKWVGAILVGILAVILVLTFTSKKGVKKTNKQGVVGIAQEPDSLDPVLAEMAAAREIQGLLFEDMLERDDQWVIQPRLVEELPTLQNGLLKQLPGDKIQVTWRFKKGLKWSDGKPLTVHDVVFAYQLVMDERIPVISRDAEKRIEKMETPDDQTLVVTWKEPYAYAGIASHWILPKHIVEPIYKADPDKYKESFFGRQPIGNGPYELEEWVSGSHLSFKPNGHWNGEKPKFERIIY
ncbi:MAG: ABC transporter substrate-binding protein, partial [Deltaproteobacteria bacterium]